jgi:hypothetical protein
MVPSAAEKRGWRFRVKPGPFGAQCPEDPPILPRPAAPPDRAGKYFKGPAQSATQCTGSYPCFYPVGHAADTVIPIMNVHQALY